MAHLPWVLALAGFAVMYAPSYWAAIGGIWQTDEMAHGPIVLAVVLWAFWQARGKVANAEAEPSYALGWPLFACGLLLYAVARVFSMSSIEFASQILVAASCLLLLRGPDALRAAWFPILYMVFLVPMPASFVDAVTGPLKQWISFIVVDLLHAVGYPIARAGVTISIGPYQLLVADACSGLNSMIGLAAIGVLFMHVTRRDSRLHTIVMLAAILPIAFFANVVRVTSLVLVTYELGDDAGQGFLHGAAGMMLFLVALAMLFVLDVVVAAIVRRTRSTVGQPSSQALRTPG
jgi:exosortase B